MLEQNLNDFMQRHGDCVRDPDNEQLWLFEDGAAYRESWVRGDSQAMEPSPIPADRLQVQIRYLSAAYAKTWREFNGFRRNYSVMQMRQHGVLLKELHERLEAAKAEFDELPEVLERRMENEDKAYREEFVAMLKFEQETKLRDEARAIAEQVENECPMPPEVGTGPDFYPPAESRQLPQQFTGRHGRAMQGLSSAIAALPDRIPAAQPKAGAS